MVRKRRDPNKLRRLRQVVQIGFLIIFAFLLVRALSGRVRMSWVPLLAMTLTTVVLTLALGRVWCGWVCPLNTILDWVKFDMARERGTRLSNRWRAVKYVLLFLIVLAALWGLLRPETVLTINIDQTRSPTHNLLLGSGVVVIALAAIVGMDAITEHFWCRYLCPLGGAVALLSKIAFMRRIVRDHCNECSVCVDACPLGAIDPRRGFINDPGECTVCFDCLTSCTSSSNGFTFLSPYLFAEDHSAVKAGQVTLGRQR